MPPGTGKTGPLPRTSLRYCDDYTCTWFLAATAVAMQDGRVEINSVFRLQNELLAANSQGQRALQHVEKLDSGVLVGLNLFQGQFLKIAKKCTQFALRGAVIQTFEIVGHICTSWALRKAHAFALSHHGHHPPLAFVGEEVVQPYPEYHGYAQECGQSGKQLSPFQLRQKGRRQARVFAQFDQSHALAQAQSAQFFADGVAS